ncbi:hypothetical protein G4O51_11980 [Candidatus Bathyarchaeota archaeon A05DMB-2]|nr:hypothetical protein [Candidatus Bathyarchaeota archaeon A05DMB-2]
MQRGYVEVIGELLEETVKNPNLAPSRITARAGVGYPKLRPLIQAELVTIETQTKKRRKLRLTEKGRQYLTHYRALTQLLPKNNTHTTCDTATA